MRLLYPIIMGLITISTGIAGLNVCPRVQPRSVWRALPPTGRSQKLTVVSNIIMYHSPVKETCTSRAECAKLMQRVQKEEMKFFARSDTLYNYFLAFDGLIYEGAGWTTVSPAPDTSNYDTLHICIIGHRFNIIPPTATMLENFFSWLECQQERGFLLDTYSVWFRTNRELKEIQQYQNKYPSIFDRLNVGGPLLDYLPPAYHD